VEFRIVERIFSEDESSPSVLIANIYGEPNIEKNLHKMEQIIEIAHKKRVYPDFSGVKRDRLYLENKR